MDIKKILCAIIVFLLLGGNIILGMEYLKVRKELNRTQVALDAHQTNKQVLDFTKLFIDKVLKADKEVDFDTRLTLENMVRNINDEEILNQWKKFAKSETEEDTRKEVIALLEILMNKISQ